jgi:hypothetical protein
MRHTLLAGLAGAVLAVPAAPAHAVVTAAVLTCEVNFTGFVTGTGNGACNLDGVVGTAAFVFAPETMNFVYTTQPAPCGLIGSASGVLAGPLATGFNWQWIGPHGELTLVGGVTGAGLSQSVTILGNPCSGPQTQTVVFELAGI